MTKRLEELFDLPPVEDPEENTNEETLQTFEPVANTVEGLSTLEKIEAGLPAVRGLEASDQEMDELAKLARESFEELQTLGMNVDSRFSAEIFAVAGTMLGHAITAKTAKVNKKLRMLDLQMKQAKLQADLAKRAEQIEAIPTAEGVVLDRNSLIERLQQGTSKH